MQIRRRRRHRRRQYRGRRRGRVHRGREEGRRLGLLLRRQQRDEIFRGRSDQQGQRREPARGVEASAGGSGDSHRECRPANLEQVHRLADHGERRALCARRPRAGRGDGSGDGADAVDAAAADARNRRPARRRRALGRRVLAAGFRRTHLHDARAVSLRAQREDGRADRRFRRRRQGGSQRRPRPAHEGLPLERRSPHRPRRRRHRLVDARAGLGENDGRAVRATCARTTSTPASCAGRSTSSRTQASRAPKRGRTSRTSTPAPATSGR